jgi:superoxide dismutase, Fe-Mn family
MTIDLERRAFVQTGALLAAGTVLTSATADPAAAQTSTQSAGAKPMSYAVKPLPFDPKKIKGLSEKLLTSHHKNNYSGAVKRLNAITEQLAGLDFGNAPGFMINGLKREELIAANSMILHELYFAGLGEESRPGRRSSMR